MRLRFIPFVVRSTEPMKLQYGKVKLDENCAKNINTAKQDLRTYQTDSVYENFYTYKTKKPRRCSI